MGNAIRYEVDRSDIRYPRLAPLKEGAEFSENTVDVLVVQIDDGTQHVISFGREVSPDSDWQVRDGFVKIYDGEPNSPAMRTYNRWTFFERVPYASQIAAEPEFRSLSPQDFDAHGRPKD